MMNKISVSIALLSMSLLCLGCRLPAPPLHIPKAETVKSIVVQGELQPTSEGNHHSRQEVVVQEREKINLIVKFLEGRNDGWSKPSDTFPTAQYSIILNDPNGQPILTIRIGPDWIGARDVSPDSSHNRLRNLSPADRKELNQLLGAYEHK
jgi:hypothetical protein